MMTDRDAGLDPHLNDRPWERAGASTAPLLLWLYELNTIYSACQSGTPDGEPEWRRGNGDDSVRMHGDPSFSKGFGKTGEQPAPALIGQSVSDSRQIRTAVP